MCLLDREMELCSFSFCDSIQSIPPTCSDLWYLLTNKQFVYQFSHVQLIKKTSFGPDMVVHTFNTSTAEAETEAEAKAKAGGLL